MEHRGSPSDVVIRVENLSKRYDDTVAVDDVNFTVARGSATALLGGNGAGKTTTIAMLLGIVIPTSGTVTVLGEDMITHRYRVLPRINFASPYVDLPKRLRVEQNLAGLRPSLRRPPSARQGRGDRRGARYHGVSEAPVRQPFVGREDPRLARQGADQRPGSAVAR